MIDELELKWQKNGFEERQLPLLKKLKPFSGGIRNGKTPADALFDNELIERLEYGIVKNGKSNKELAESLTSIININKSLSKFIYECCLNIDNIIIDEYLESIDQVQSSVPVRYCHPLHYIPCI